MTLRKHPVLKRILWTVFLAAAISAGVMVHNVHKAVKHSIGPVNEQRKESHIVLFLDEDESPTSFCTSTAVGPHALLTAEHCNPRMEQKTLRIDLSTRKYHILAYAADNRDHIILLLDGPAFLNYSKITTAAPVLGEKVTFYGFGGKDFPSHIRSGSVISCGTFDISDVDAAQGVVCMKLKAIPGDSGSAIYNSLNQIVALTTYAFDDDDDGNNEEICLGFQLDFPVSTIEQAYTFTPKETQHGNTDSNTPKQPSLDELLKQLFNLYRNSY